MLRRSELDPDPFRQFQQWYEQALRAGLHEPQAMTLATASAGGRPSARMVILRQFDANGFVFYTNYHSRKGTELAENPWAALVFYWGPLGRQVRVEGRVEKTAPETSDAYFAQRSRGRLIGAWASPQSQVIESRDWLETQIEALENTYAQQAVPRPPHWGGYRVIPDAFEFWQSGDERLHDRFRYQQQPDGNWAIARLAP